MAYQACEAGGTFPAVLNAANEIAVQAFLDHNITFDQIPAVIEAVLERHETSGTVDLSDIMAADAQARVRANDVVEKLRH